MNIWLFGKSSDFSQHMIDQWHKEGYQVTEFGRENVNYMNPAEFVEQVKQNLPLPDFVVYNINVGVPFELNRPIHKQNVDTQKIIFNEWYQNNLNVNFFKVFLFDWLLENNFKGEVAHITSQIAKDTNPEYKNLLIYKMQRALDYQIIQNERAHSINSYGICPANIQDNVEWPKYIAKLICDKNKNASWLYGIIKDKDLDYIYYPSEGLYDKTNNLPE
tara:strand:+ start:279 stop:932 length:654 start_codon:yes stop_codon:yes gene_type:complete